MRKSFTRLFSIFVLLLGLSFQMAYGIVFVPANSVPTDGNLNAKPTDFATKFVVAFDAVPVISDAGGTLVIYKNGGLFKTLPITKTSTDVVVVGKTIEVTHGIASFTQGEVYTVSITDGAVTGLAAGALAGPVVAPLVGAPYDFTIGDYVAPKLLTTAALFTPALGAVDVMGTLNASAFSLVLPFDEAVNVPAATNNLAVYIYKEDGTVVDIIRVGKVLSTTITGGGTAFITVPVANTAIFQENTKYYVTVDAGAFVDVSPNANAFGGLSAKTTWTFTTRDNSAPAISAKSVTAITTTTATLTVSLSEKGKYYYGVYPAAATPTVANIVAGTGAVVFGNKVVATAGTDVTASLAGLTGGIAYKVYIVTENSVSVGAPVVGTSSENIAFTTIDNTAPLAVNRGVINDASKKTNGLFMVFNEQVQGGTGSLDLRLKSDDSYIKSINASSITSTKITTAADAARFGGTINVDWVVVIDLGMTLPSKVDYYVVFPDGYIKDMATGGGNAFASGGAFGIPINKGNWWITSSDFEKPVVTVTFVTPLSLSSVINIHFDETVAKQLGTTTDWAQVVALEKNNTPVAFTVAPALAANTTDIDLTPAAPLSSNTVYTVKLRPDAVKDLNNNAIVTENVYSLTTGDLDVFAVQYGSSKGAAVTTNLLANSTIKIDFNKAVKVFDGTNWVSANATNIKPLITFQKGGTAQTFDVTYDAATFTVTITPTTAGALVCNAADYTVALDGTKVKDSQGALLSVSAGYVAVQAYTVTDYLPPVAVTSHSGDVSTIMPLTITFTDDNLATLTDLSGGALSANMITFKEVNSNSGNLAFGFAYNAATGVITITPTVALATGSTYYYGIGASVKDAAGNVTAGKFSTFKMIVAAPIPAISAVTYTLNGSTPATPVATKLVNITPKTGNIVTLTVTFNDNIKEVQSVVPYNTVSLTDGFGTWTTPVMPTNVSGNTLTVDFNTGGSLVSGAVCTITLPGGIVQGSTAYTNTPVPTFAQFATQTILFDAKDIIKPTVSANTPAAAAAGIALNTPIKIGFSETVIRGTGNILIKEGATVIQTIAVNDANVSITGTGAATVATIIKTGDLVKYNTTYTLEVPTTAFTDLVSLNPLAALYSGTFTTIVNPLPTVSTYLPANGADVVATNTSISLTFSEEVEKNYTPGTLTLKGVYLVEKKSAGPNAILSGPNSAFDVNGGTDVLVASKYIDDVAVAISGNTVTLNFGVALEANKDYYILIAPESFKDKSTGTGTIGNPIPGLSTGIIATGTWNFTTKDVLTPLVTSYAYTKRADNKVALTSDITITFSKPIEKVSGSAITSADIANLFTLTKVAGPGTLGVKAFIGTINDAKNVVTILNSSLVTLGEFTELSNYTIEINAAAVRGVTNHVVLGANLDAFTTSDYTAPVVTPSIVNAIADVKKDEATVQFVSTDNQNLATVYYTYQAGDATTATPAASVVKNDKSKAIAGASPQTVTYKFTGLTEETSYVVWAVAVDQAGNESAVSKVVFVTDDVTKPKIAAGGLPTSFDAAGQLTFTFDEAVVVAPANMAVRILDQASMVELARLNLNAVLPSSATNDKKLITDAFAGLAGSNTLVNYYVEVDKGIVTDVPVVAGDAVNTFDGLYRTDLMVTSKDVTAPVLTSPVTGFALANADVNFNLKLTFSEAVQKLATLPVTSFFLEKEITPGSGTYEPFEVIDPANVVTNGTNEVIVTVARQLASTTKYQLTVNKAAFEDLAGNDHAAGFLVGTLTTKDVVTPTVAFLPAKNAPAVLITTTTLTLTFSEAIRLLDNTAIDSYDLDSLVYFKKGGSPMAFDAVLDGTNKIITITPVAALVKDATYTYGFKAKFEDAANNMVPANEATFNTEATSAAAQYLTWTPTKQSPYLAPWTTPLVNAGTVTLNFSSAVFTANATAAKNNLALTPAILADFAGYGILTVKKNGVAMVAADLVFGTPDNKTITVAPKTNWGSSSVIEVTVNGATLQVGETNVTVLGVLLSPFDASTYAAQDVVAPKVDVTYALFPAPGAAGYYPAKVGVSGISPVIAKTETLKLYFDEDVQVGTGTVEIHHWDGRLAKTMAFVVDAVDKKLVSLASNLTDAVNLPTNEEYYAIVNAGAVTDFDVTAKNSYAGLTDVKVWKFILKDDKIPQVQSYTPVASNTPVNTDLTINFDRPVVLTGAGYVALYKSALGGDAVQIWRGADNGLTSAFSVSGSSATMNISDLDVNTQYFVEVASGTFASVANANAQPAIPRANWTFTTEVNTKPSIIAGGYSPAKDEAGVLLNKDLEITFDMPVEKGSGNIQLHAADGSIILNFDVNGPDVTFSLNSPVVKVNLPTLTQNKQYYVIIPSTAIRNQTYTPEYFAGVIVPYEWKFNTVLDGTAPTVVSVSPTVSTGAKLNEVSLKLTLSENVKVGTGNIVVYNAANDTIVQTIDIATTTIVGAVVTTGNLTGLKDLTTYYVNVAPTALTDMAPVANPFAGIVNKTTWKFKTGDFTAPTLVVTPPASPVTTVFTVGLKFNEPVSGVMDAVTATGGTVKVDALVGGTDYVLTVSTKEQTLVTIVLDNTIKDISPNTNAFAGKTLTYTTGDFTKPELLSMAPSLDAVITGNHPVLTMNFAENVAVGAGGSLKIYKVNTTTAVLTIPVTAAMVVGKDVTVSYVYNATTGGLDKNTRYYVLVDGTALKDIAGNTFDGVSDATAWTFKTGPSFSTGIDPIVDGSLEFKVYPNPFVDYVNVDNASKLSKIVVTNIAGQTVKEVVKPTDRIQLNELRSGIYFMSMYDMDNVVKNTAKIVKR